MGCACPREGCAQSPGQPGMSTEQPAQLPLLACLFPSRLHSAGFLWGFFPYYTFQAPSGLEMISSDAGGESQPASALHGEMELPWAPLPHGWGPTGAPGGTEPGGSDPGMLCSHPPTEFLTWLALEECAGTSECLAPGGMLSRTDGISAPSCCSAAQLSPAEPS